MKATRPIARVIETLTVGPVLIRIDAYGRIYQATTVGEPTRTWQATYKK